MEKARSLGFSEYKHISQKIKFISKSNTLKTYYSTLLLKYAAADNKRNFKWHNLLYVKFYLILLPSVGQVPFEFLDSQSFNIIDAPCFFTKPLEIVKAAYYREGDYVFPSHVQVCWVSPCDPMDYSPPSSSVHGILQARIREWVAMSSSRGSSRPKDWTHISFVYCIGSWVLYHKCHLGSPFHPRLRGNFPYITD